MEQPAWFGYPQTIFCLAKQTKQVPFLINAVLNKLREHCSWSLSRRQLSAWLKRKSFKARFIRPVLLGEDNHELDSKCGNQKKIRHKEWKRASISVLFGDEALPPAMKSKVLPRLLMSWNAVLQFHYISLPFCLRSQK